jgi:DNA polymerase-3 subunit alpha
MEKFAEYGFNKSHSAAYALVAYQTAWLKAHYPAAFMAAVLSADMDNTDKVVFLIDECRDMNLTVLPPDVNSSKIHFTVADEKTIRYGLGAIKGVGEAALKGIVEERASGEAFNNLFDFCRRVDMKKINKRVMDSLVKAGAFDSISDESVLDLTGANKMAVLAIYRAKLEASLSKAMQVAEQHRKNADTGQNDMFGFIEQTDEQQQEDEPLESADAWSDQHLLQMEKETLGLYLSGHPIDRYVEELARFIPKRINKLDAPESKGYKRNEVAVITAGLIVAIRTMKGKNGGRMALITIDDQTARLEVRVFAEVFEKYQDRIQPDKLVVIQGKIAQDNFTGGLAATAEAVYDMPRAREMCGKSLVIKVDNQQASVDWLTNLQSIITPFREGALPIEIDYTNSSARTLIQLGSEWMVTPSDHLLIALNDLGVVSDALVKYETVS